MYVFIPLENCGCSTEMLALPCGPAPKGSKPRDHSCVPTSIFLCSCTLYMLAHHFCISLRLQTMMWVICVAAQQIPICHHHIYNITVLLSSGKWSSTLSRKTLLQQDTSSTCRKVCEEIEKTKIFVCAATSNFFPRSKLAWYFAVEETVRNWVHNERSKRLIVSCSDIEAKAHAVGEDMCILQTEFKASKKWANFSLPISWVTWVPNIYSCRVKWAVPPSLLSRLTRLARGQCPQKGSTRFACRQ